MAGRWTSHLPTMPAVELRDKDGTFTISAALPGVRVKDITVDITPQDIVINATEHKHDEDKGLFAHVHHRSTN
jgi:HSP20 family molecular chaperone IbpA